MRYWILIFVLLYSYLFGVLLNHENAWMHPEVADTTSAILQKHTSFADRFSQFLNWQLFGGQFEGKSVCLPRLFTHIFQTGNILLRNWLFQYIPPHPSFSITWLFALFLAPYFFYKLMWNLTRDKNIARLTAALYLCLPGSLIPVIMLFHPGKPMSNFFYIFCLYLGSRLQQNLGSLTPDRFKRDFFLLSLTIFLSLFFDEYCLFLFILLPLFYPEVFWDRNKVWTTAVYLAIPLLYYLTVVYNLPKLYAWAGYPGFDVLAFTGIQRYVPTIQFFSTPVNFVLRLHDNLGAGFNAYLTESSRSVFSTHFLAIDNSLNTANIRFGWSLLNDNNPNFLTIIHNFLLLGVGALVLLFLFKIRRQVPNHAMENLFLRAILALLLYSGFFSFLHVLSNILSGCAWYGCNFSILFALAVGLLCKIMLDALPKSKILIGCFLATLMLSGLWNTRLTNYAWMSLHYRVNYWELDLWLNVIHRRYFYEKYFSAKKENNFELTYQAWQKRKFPAARELIILQTPLDVRYYLNAELKYIK